MRALLQRVTQAAVAVDGTEIAAIGPGLVVLLGVGREDTDETARTLADRVAHYRIFEDDLGKINRSVLDEGGSALVVSQFTLQADTEKGLRPGFDPAAAPEAAEPLYRAFVETLAAAGIETRTGDFRAHMQVSLVNDGPATFLLER